MKQALQTFAELGRVSNLPSVWFNLATGWILAGSQSISPLLWLMLGGTGFYLAGMIWNDAADASWDRTHNVSRPIPSGRISATRAWLLGITVWMIGCGAFFVAGVPWYGTLTLTLVILAYDLYHKPWPGSVWLMAACRGLLAPIAAAAGYPVFSPTSGSWWLHPLLWGLILAFYIAGLSLCARASAREPLTPRRMLPLAIPLAVCAVAGIFHPGVPFFICWTACAVLVWFAWRLLNNRPPRIGVAVGWLLAGMILIDSMAWALAGSDWWWLPLASVPALRWFQRWVSAN